MQSQRKWARAGDEPGKAFGIKMLAKMLQRSSCKTHLRTRHFVNDNAFGTFLLAFSVCLKSIDFGPKPPQTSAECRYGAPVLFTGSKNNLITEHDDSSHENPEPVFAI